MTAPRRRGRRGRVESAEFLAFLRRILVAAGRRGIEMDPEDFAELIKLHDELSRAVVAAVVNMRGNAFTWTEIAAAAGITRQSAHERWSKHVRAYDAARAADATNEACPQERAVATA